MARTARARVQTRTSACWMSLLFTAALVLCPGVPVAAAAPAPCRKVTLEGEVSIGKSWQAPIGRGWVFRVLPIAAGAQHYSGWDLVMDRAQPAGYPDALLVATLPYNSINEREVGTTYGLRAQDAIAWNPRNFRFLTDAARLREAQQDFLRIAGNARGNANPADPKAAAAHLLALEKGASAGQFRILDARLTPGIQDPAPYARALAATRTPYQVDAMPNAPPLGELHWIRFSVTLWLPAGWPLPAGVSASPSVCGR